MYVDRIMTREVITVEPDTKLRKIAEIMQQRKLRHLPVVDGAKRLVGIVSHRDVQRAEPSAITTLDKGEANYLLAKVSAAGIMHKEVVTCAPATLIEDAGRLMREHKIGCLPVVEDERLVGILTTVDLLDFFLEITGCMAEGSARIAVRLPDETGRLAQLLAQINRDGGQIRTVVSPLSADESGMRTVIVRFAAEDAAAIDGQLRMSGYDVISEELPKE